MLSGLDQQLHNQRIGKTGLWLVCGWGQPSLHALCLSKRYILLSISPFLLTPSFWPNGPLFSTIEPFVGADKQFEPLQQKQHCSDSVHLLSAFCFGQNKKWYLFPQCSFGSVEIGPIIVREYDFGRLEPDYVWQILRMHGFSGHRQLHRVHPGKTGQDGPQLQ